ncbi:hypothetical protein [Bradyrhizobium sp. Tv2a-2]|jgi:hypothetical protein|uniref:hypothetical protein n=1 Tax=Bradyrhizobium sp. Tv2a-2 TaxID=113395 RepID=UPI0004657A31|nr:hypothetical protein [Bradyrhizobium sp. Tv2a-2]
MRRAALIVAALAVVALLQPSRAPAAWWKRAPVDFEECADAAAKAATKEDKTAGLADCNAKFAGRRKSGGGYTYYDFMQDRSFDIAGPNPTPEEQRYIDQQYTLYLEKQRRNSVEAALSARQQQDELQQEQPQPLQSASLRTEAERVPIPQARPSKQIDGRPRCPRQQQHSFSCDWPRLSDTINDLKKLFGGSQAKDGAKDAAKDGKGKKS